MPRVDRMPGAVFHRGLLSTVLYIRCAVLCLLCDLLSLIEGEEEEEEEEIEEQEEDQLGCHEAPCFAPPGKCDMHA